MPEKAAREHYEELWVPIEDYPNYEISNYGRIVNTKTDYELQITHSKYKKDQVNLYNNGKVKRFYVHRLVARAFFQNYRDDIEVLHVNQYSIHDNSVLNLTLGGPINQGHKPIRKKTYPISTAYREDGIVHFGSIKPAVEEKINIHIEGYGKISVAMPEKRDDEAIGDLIAETVRLVMTCVDPRTQVTRFHPALGFGGYGAAITVQEKA